MTEIKSNADIEPCLSVVMPVFNEAATVADVIKTVLAQRPVQQLVIVDDASRDGTWDKLQPLATGDSRIKLVRHEVNQGKGAALRTGFAQATSPIVIIQDADLEYDPAEYHRLLGLICPARRTWCSARGSPAPTRTACCITGIGREQNADHPVEHGDRRELTDMETCYKTFRREIIQKIKIEENRFGFEPEITAKVARLKVRIYEVAISYSGRTYMEGKKIGWRDGIQALWCIFKYNFLPGHE